MAKLVVLCPGQGAQKAGMGKAWFDASPAAKAIFEEADAVLGDSLGLPLSEICFSDPNGEINKTNISQPAIYTCSVASWIGIREQGLEGDLVATAGLSLGEYTSLHLAGVFSFADGLRLVARRGGLHQKQARWLRLWVTTTQCLHFVKRREATIFSCLRILMRLGKQS